MSEVSTSSTPQRQAIVDRLRQRIESFRKHHDNCLARLEETQPSRELKEQEETHLLHIKFLENKVKMNPKIRLDQVGKISKQGVNVGQEKAANTVGQAMKRRVDSPQPQIDGEGNLPSNDDLASLVPQKYQRFEGPSDVHVKVKPPNFAGPGDTLPLQTSMSFPHVNGHGGEFPKSEELSKPVVSSYSGSTCENIDRMVTRVPQQYPGNFTSSTFTNRGQPSVSDNLRTSDYPVNFKQENGLLNSDVEGPASIVNGFSSTCTKSEGEFGRLLTTYAENPKSKSKDEDLKTQISQFELVLQGIKNRDGIYNESESKKDVLATAKQPMNTQSSSLVSGLSDSVSHEGAKGSNQLGLSNGNGPNNGTRLPTVAVTSSTHRQHGISPSTAEALQQFVTQKEERLATKVPFERPLFLNPQSVGREQNSTGMPPRPNNFAPIRQIVFDQIQQRRTNQQRAKIHGSQTPQLHARNPAMNPLAATSPYQMHPKVRYPSLSPSTGQPVPSFTPNGRVQQNLMASVHHPSAVPQQQPQPQLQNIPQHQISMYAQQRIAFQRQMATRLPSYSQTQHMSPASMMDIRQKFPGGVHTSHTAQYPVQQQATRNPQPLSHLQHYPNAYSGHSGTQSRPLQPAFMGEHSRYQNPYTNSVNQDNKMHSVYQRHASLDDNLASPRYHNQNGRNTFTYQRSSSMPGHGGVAKNVFNQTSPPVVRLEQTKQNLPDLNNNGNEQRQELTHLHPHPQPQPAVQQPPLTHLKQQQVSQANNLNMNQEQLYQASGLINRSRTQTTANLQQTFSNSFSNLLDLKSNSESSLFPFFGQETSGTSTDNADFDSLLKSPPSDFNLLHILENEPQKALQ